MLGNSLNMLAGAGVSAVQQSKTPKKESKAPQPPFGVEAEQQFAKRYKGATGQDLHPQYVDVRLKSDGQVHRMLAYEVDGKPYVPQLDGIDLPFMSVQKLGQIPSLHDVASGRYTVGKGQDTAGQIDQEALANALPPEILQMLGFPNAVATGNTPRRENFTPNTMPMAATPNGADPANRTMLLGNQAAVASSGQSIQGNQVVSEYPGMPNTNNPVQASVPGQNGPGVGTVAPPMVGAGIPSGYDMSAQQPNMPAAPSNPMDLVNLLRSNVPDTRVKEASDKRTAAAALKPETAKPRFHADRLLTVLALAALAGPNGGDVLKGALRGTMDATANRQAEMDKEYGVKRNTLLSEAQGLEDQVKEKNATDNKNFAIAQFLDAQETKKDLAKMTAEEKQKDRDLKLTVAQQRYDVSRMNTLMKMSPEQRVAQMAEWDREEGTTTDPRLIQALSQATPNEFAKMASANLSVAKTKTEDKLRPFKERLLQAQGDRQLSGKLLDEARTKSEGFRSQLLEDQVKWFDKTAAAKLSNLNASTKQHLAAAEKVRSSAFNADGSLGPSATSLVAQWGSFEKAANAADAEAQGKMAFVQNAKARLEAINKEIATKSKDPNAMFDIGGGLDKLQKEKTKLENGIDAAEAEVVGLTELAKQNRESLKKLSDGTAWAGSKSGLSKNQLTSARNAEIRNNTWNDAKEADYIAKIKAAK